MAPSVIVKRRHAYSSIPDEDRYAPEQLLDPEPALRALSEGTSALSPSAASEQMPLPREYVPSSFPHDTSSLAPGYVLPRGDTSRVNRRVPTSYRSFITDPDLNVSHSPPAIFSRIRDLSLQHETIYEGPHADVVVPGLSRGHAHRVSRVRSALSSSSSKGGPDSDSHSDIDSEDEDRIMEDNEYHHDDDVVDHLDVIDPQVATVAALTNAANSILLPPIAFYSRKPVVILPRTGRDQELDGASVHTASTDELDRHVHAASPSLSGHINRASHSDRNTLSSYSLARTTMSTTSSQTFYTANSSLAGRTVSMNTDSTVLSEDSYHYSVISVNSYKSRKNVLYPRRMHPPPATLSPATMLPVPECPGVVSLDPDMVAWEVRYLCVDLLPHSETRLLPAGRVLLRSLGEETDPSSQRKSDETRYCSELFIMLAREILLKDAIGVEELEGPCRILHLTFSDILVKSGAFDAPTTSNESCTDTQGPERFSSLLRVIISLMDAFEAALNVVNPLPTSDETLREHRRKVSQHFSVATDLTMAQYRKLVMQWSRSRSEGRNLNDETEPPLLLGGKPSTRDVFPVGANISSASVKTMFLYNSGVTVNPVSLPATPSAALGDNVRRTADPGAHSLPASTSKARKVMHWFRSQSKGRGLDDESEPSPPLVGKPPVRDAFPVSANIQWVHVAAPSYTSDVEYTSVPLRMYPPHPERTTGTETEGAPAAPSFAELVRRHVAPPPGIIRTHHGAVNQATVTTGVPIEIMRHVRDVLVRMYVEVQIESEYKYRCVRAKRRRRGPPAPSGIGLGLRGDPEISPSPILSPGGQAVAPGELGPEPVYGDPSQDQGDEVRFYVELTKLDGLKDTYSIDIRRLKGNLRSYKFLYDYITQHLELQR